MKSYAVYELSPKDEDTLGVFVGNIQAKNQWHARRILKQINANLVAREVKKSKSIK